MTEKMLKIRHLKFRTPSSLFNNFMTYLDNIIYLFSIACLIMFLKVLAAVVEHPVSCVQMKTWAEYALKKVNHLEHCKV
jgi:hypothetical protein